MIRKADDGFVNLCLGLKLYRASKNYTIWPNEWHL